MSNFSDLIELETNASINALDENISEFEKAILFKNQHVKNVRAKKITGVISQTNKIPRVWKIMISNMNERFALLLKINYTEVNLFINQESKYSWNIKLFQVYRVFHQWRLTNNVFEFYFRGNWLRAIWATFKNYLEIYRVSQQSDRHQTYVLSYLTTDLESTVKMTLCLFEVLCAQNVPFLRLLDFSLIWHYQKIFHNFNINNPFIVRGIIVFTFLWFRIHSSQLFAIFATNEETT